MLVNEIVFHMNGMRLAIFTISASTVEMRPFFPRTSKPYPGTGNRRLFENLNFGIFNVMKGRIVFNG
jgi:hypothetical protein